VLKRPEVSSAKAYYSIQANPDLEKVFDTADAPTKARMMAEAKQRLAPQVTSARHAEVEASASKLGPEFQEANYGHEINRLEQAVRNASDPEVRNIAVSQLADTRDQLAEFRSKSKPSPIPQPQTQVPKVPAKNFDLEAQIRQTVTDPSDLRRAALKSKAQEAIALPREQALQVAGDMDAKASSAAQQAGIIRNVLDRQGDVEMVRAKLGAWSTAHTGELDPETGKFVKGSSGVSFENSATPAERDIYNRLLGRKLEETRAMDPDTRRVVQTPKVGSPEEAQQVKEFIQRLSVERDGIVDQIRGGMPATDEAVQRAAELHDQITALTGMRDRAPAGTPGVRGVAGKAAPEEISPGVWGPSSKAPLPELSQELYNRLMGREPTSRLAIKPALLEKRIGQLNEEARLRSTISRAIRSAHGDPSVAELAPPTPVEVKPAAPRVRPARPALEQLAEDQHQLQENIRFAKELPDASKAPEVPPKPPDEPGYFTAKVLDESGQQTGWKKVKLQGPGTPGVDQGSDQSTPIRQLTETLQARIPPNTSIAQRVIAAHSLGDALTNGKNAFQDAVVKVQAGAAGIIHTILSPPEWTDFKANAGRYSKALQVLAQDRLDMNRAFLKAHPVRLERIGITNFVQAGGDTEVLTRWRDGSQGALRKGYDAALNLSDESKLTAYHIKATQDSLWDELHTHGVLDSFFENYMKGAWKQDDMASAVRNSYRVDTIRPNPGLARQKFYQNYFEGEQAGKTPLNKDAAFLTDLYYREAQQTLASRAYVRGLHDGLAADGEPIVTYAQGTGRLMPAQEGRDAAYIIQPRGSAVAGDGRPYRYLDHPALRKYTYATQDELGQNIFVKGDALVHPDHFDALKNQLDKSSWLRSNAVGRLALKTSGGLKNLMLAFSAFHEGQLELHAMFHGINPLGVKPVDVSSGPLNELMDGGLTLRDPNGQMQFSEGMTGGGLPGKIPGAGPLYMKYNDWLWNDRIPALKQAMAEKAYAHNLQRYSASMSREQVAELTAKQANAAFGGQNYIMLARSQGVQDVMRLMALAPDFLESRFKFAGQALKPGGREQATALVRGTLGLYATARVANMAANNGDPHWDTPFGMVLGGRVYQMRSIPSDIFRLVSDPRSFAYDRLNPYTTRSGIEALTGRDELGRRVGLGDQAVDLAKQVLPIPAQKYLSQDHSGILDAALQMIGVQSNIYRTPGLTEARQLYFQREPAAARNSGPHALRDIEDAYARQSPSADRIADDAINKGEVSLEQVNKIIDQADQPEIERWGKKLTLPELAEVWKKASPSEKDALQDVILEKQKALDTNTTMPDKQREEWERALETGFK
jgi:hypothetical protein